MTSFRSGRLSTLALPTGTVWLLTDIAEIDPEEFRLQLASRPFPVRGYRRIAVKVVDVYGNESTVVKEL